MLVFLMLNFEGFFYIEWSYDCMLLKTDGSDYY